MRFKLLFIILIIVVAIILALFAYAAQLLHNAYNSASAPHSTGSPSLSAFFLSKNLLSYESNRYLVPSVQLGYSTVNISNLYVNATLLARPPPSSFFILNTSGSCFNCGHVQQTIGLIGAYLHTYGLVQNASNVSVLGEQNLASVPNDSVLIILNGVLPDYMLSQAPSGTGSMIQYLLDKGTDIIYVGRNFANASSGQILVPVGPQQLPSFLAWTTAPGTASSSFHFDSSTFSLAGGVGYGPLSYITVGSGSLLVFSNYLNSWSNSSYAAQDIAKAASQLFWLPKYASGAAVISPQNPSNYSGNIGLPLINLNEFFTPSVALATPIAYGRVVMYNNANYSATQNRSLYRYVSYTQSFTQNGTILLPQTVVPTVGLPTKIVIPTGSNVPIEVEPHIAVYNLNMTLLESIPLQPFTASGNFTQIQTLAFYLPPGQYIAQVQGFFGKQYGVSLFNVSPISIALVNANYSSGTFLFSITSEQTPLSGINYTINVNGLYPSSGTVTGGSITYALPTGTPEQRGAIAFNIGLLSRTFTYRATNAPYTIKINNQYIELAIVVILAIIIVTVVKAPNRDEFYIDVPAIREQKEIPIKIKAAELALIFDKQNIYYRWNYMPLSVEETKQAISNHIKVNNVAVNLTYSNVELLLTQMSAAGYLVSADNLYAPKAWVSKSGHDIEYLATFKKLRIYFVSHAYQFNDIDTSDRADIVATIHNERVYIVIYSRTSKFQKVPVFADAKTYIAFLNSDRVYEFEKYLRTTTSAITEELRMYISAGQVLLVDADSPGEVLR
jgi:hypothetical protein